MKEAGLFFNAASGSVAAAGHAVAPHQIGGVGRVLVAPDELIRVGRFVVAPDQVLSDGDWMVSPQTR